MVLGCLVFFYLQLIGKAVHTYAHLLYHPLYSRFMGLRQNSTVKIAKKLPKMQKRQKNVGRLRDPIIGMGTRPKAWGLCGRHGHCAKV